MNKPLLRDSFFATVAVFLVGGLIKLILLLHFSFLDPVHTAVHHVKEEYENLITDIASGKITGKGADKPEIYLVNTDTLGRSDIALLLKRIDKWKPKVIGVDIAFNKRDAKGDTTLANTLRQISDKLVSGTFYRVDRKGEIVEKLEKSDSAYRYGTEGYTNFVSATANEVVRSFLPLREQKGDDKIDKSLSSFALAIVEKYDSTSYRNFRMHRHGVEPSVPETIVYQHSMPEYSFARSQDIFNDSLSFEEFRDKIVLVGYIGDQEDLHYSSFNPDGEIADMNGLAIHANIIEMILKKDYITHVKTWQVWVISFFTCFGMMIFFVKQFVKHHLTFHIIFKLVQFASAVVIFGIGLMLFYSFQLKMDTLIIIAPIALAVDVLYFYDSFVQWLHRKFGYETYFTSTHGHQ